MAILFISDIHLCDKRNSRAFELRRLKRLADWIRESQFEMVINLGDTVSRDSCLREGLSPYRQELFEEYLSWRKTLGIPVLECGLHREFSFFQQLYGQSTSYVHRGVPGITAFAISPDGPADNILSPKQLQWFEEELDKSESTSVVVGTHIPYSNSCSRPINECCYVKIPDALHRRLENFPKPVFWAGGHYHWRIEPPVQSGSLWAFMGGRFSFEAEPQKKTYFRILNTQTLTLETIECFEN